MISLLGIYRPGRTPLHRAPAWSKMLLLLAISILSIAVSDPVTSLGILAASLLLLASTRPPLATTLKGMLAIAVLAVLAAGFQIWRGDYVRALDLAGDLISIAALALAVSSSTSMSDMLELVTALARPLRWVLPPETIGVMVSLTLRSIPEAARILTEARIAARARGLERDPRAILIPSASRTVGFALQLGQALHARGIAEHGRAARLPVGPDTRDDAHPRVMAEPPVREATPTGETPVQEPRARRGGRRAHRDEAVETVAEPAPAPPATTPETVVTTPEPATEPEPEPTTGAIPRWGRVHEG
ncbi:energy-coupling factor transporter transmembrane component T [Demequina soli]|uniref:energy-coupling factor transporter transmembrane component T n=1 Tax=Demequina soli TaxID=1638987 RepID=UPI0007811D91|nr:energy-coupling factor transporter transmembrane component T [Demequina soli]